MSARRFQRNVVFVMLVYALTIFALFGCHQLDINKFPNTYNTLKDAIPLIIAFPAAWLAYCLQRRQSYLKDVRELWSKLVGAFQSAIQYTHLSGPQQSDFAFVMKQLSSAIDEVRGTFANVGSDEAAAGFFPLESLHHFLRLISMLGYGGKFTSREAKTTRAELLYFWKKCRRAISPSCKETCLRSSTALT